MKRLSILTLTVGQMATNCYIISDPRSHEGVIVDPGDDAEYISDVVSKYQVKPTRIIATHGHFDHIMAAFALTQAFAIPFVIHKKDIFLVERMQDSAQHFLRIPHADPAPAIHETLNEGDTIPVGSEVLIVLHTPGHTPGGICLYAACQKVLFCGDTIFAGGAIGRYDHAYASLALLEASVARILSYPANTRLLPGHGDETTVGDEARFHVQ